MTRRPSTNPSPPHTARGTSLSRVLGTWWDECVLFVSVYAIVIVTNLAVAYAAVAVGYTRFAQSGLSAALEQWLFWLLPVAQMIPSAVRSELAWALLGPIAWASYVWSARVMTGRTLSGSLRRNLRREYTASEVRALRWLTLGAFTTEGPLARRAVARWAVVVGVFAIKANVDLAWALVATPR